MAAIGTDIELALSLIRQGELVAMPTETVYGLAADASNPDALAKLFQVKGRPKNHPVIVHIADKKALDDWAQDVPEVAYQLADTFWPGPLTMILNKRDHVLVDVTGGQGTVALRVPNHPIALTLLREFQGGLAAPSANRFGKLSPTCPEDVLSEFGSDVAYVLDGGACEVGIESTIVDLSGREPRILRPGMVSQVALRKIEGFKLKDHSPDQEEVVRAPGSLKSHYSPHTPLKVVGRDELLAMLGDLDREKLRSAVLSFQRPPQNSSSELRKEWIVANPDPTIYARSLYRHLRKLDRSNCDWILVEDVPKTDSWTGIRDRLQRASQ